MSAIQNIIEIGQNDTIEKLPKAELNLYIQWIQNDYIITDTMESAAEDIASLRERVEAAEALVKEADVLFNQESELCDDPDTEAWIWKWKVRYYFEETDIPPHSMPEDMKA